MRVHVTRTVQIHESATPEQVKLIDQHLLEHEPIPQSVHEFRAQVERAIRANAEDFLWREREHVQVAVNVSVTEYVMHRQRMESQR